jgi:hypothetical protein
MTALRIGLSGHGDLQALFDEDQEIHFEFIVADDREHAYDLEQIELDKYIGHPDCLNTQTDARHGYLPGTQPQYILDRIAAAASRTHADNRYRSGMNNSLEMRARQSESMKEYWSDKKIIRPERPVRPGARGVSRSDETRARMSASWGVRLDKLSKRVKVNGVEYTSVSEAARALDLTRRTVVVRIGDDRYPEWVYV